MKQDLLVSYFEETMLLLTRLNVVLKIKSRIGHFLIVQVFKRTRRGTFRKDR